MIDVQVFKEWLVDRPQVIKDLADKLPPWNRYMIQGTGQYCSVVSYFEDGTVTVRVDGHRLEGLDAVYNELPIKVFGILPLDLIAIKSLR